MQAAYEFDLRSELTDVGAGQHPDGEEGEGGKAAAPDEQSTGALPGSHFATAITGMLRGAPFSVNSMYWSITTVRPQARIQKSGFISFPPVLNRNEGVLLTAVFMDVPKIAVEVFHQLIECVDAGSELEFHGFTS